MICRQDQNTGIKVRIKSYKRIHGFQLEFIIMGLNWNNVDLN